MYDPNTYEKNKVAPDTVNLVYVPKLIDAMTWNTSNGNILDYSCGPGSTGYKIVLPKLESTDWQIFSTDISPCMVEFARKNFPHSRIHYGAAGSLPDNFPFSDMQFDKIFAVNVFHFVPDVQEMLTSMFDILKPGGELGFTCSTANGTKLWKILAGMETWGPFMKDLAKFWPEWSVYGENEDPEQYFKKLFLQDTGFEEILFEYTNVDITKDADIMIDATVSGIPCLPDIPPVLHGKLKEDVCKIYADIAGTAINNPTISWKSEYICAVLRKPNKQ